MLLERYKLFKELIEVTGEEVLEEIEVVKEGGDPQLALEAIERIVKSMIETSKNEKSYFSEADEVELGEEDPEFQFQIGEKVEVWDKKKWCRPSAKETLEKLGCTKEDYFAYGNEFPEGIQGIVVGKGKYQNGTPFYAIQVERSDKKIGCYEDGLKKV